MTRRNLRSSKARSQVARAATRSLTSLLDGKMKKEQMSAEDHIARIACQHAELKAGGEKLSLPRGKLKEVFDNMSSQLYGHIASLNMNRVKGKVYNKLKRRSEEVNDYKSEDEVEVIDDGILVSS